MLSIEHQERQTVRFISQHSLSIVVCSYSAYGCRLSVHDTNKTLIKSLLAHLNNDCNAHTGLNKELKPLDMLTRNVNYTADGITIT